MFESLCGTVAVIVGAYWEASLLLAKAGHVVVEGWVITVEQCERCEVGEVPNEEG